VWLGRFLASGVLASGVLTGCATASSPAGPSDAAPKAASKQTASPAPTYDVTAKPGTEAGSQRHPARPTSLRLPSDTDVPVRTAGTSDRGLLQVPRDIRAAGWWDGGAKLADAYGAIVIAGHVDSATQGLGPFAELLSTQPGERIRVRGRGVEQTFVVDTVDRVPKASLDTRDAIFAPSGRLRLVLITCAGDFDPARGGYQDLAVVTARLAA
jgi:hypothetical protein